MCVWVIGMWVIDVWGVSDLWVGDWYVGDWRVCMILVCVVYIHIHPYMHTLPHTGWRDRTRRIFMRHYSGVGPRKHIMPKFIEVCVCYRGYKVYGIGEAPIIPISHHTPLS